MNYVVLEHIICPDGREYLLIGQRVYRRLHGGDWEPIDPDLLNRITLTGNASVQGILITEAN